MQLCVRDARMPRADFLRQFPGNEVDESWSDALAKGKANTLKPLVACSRTSFVASRS